MVSSHEFSRRKLLYAVSLATAIAVQNFANLSDLPERKFQIGDYVISKRPCDDRISSNYGGWDWECGFVVGFCWNYDEWLVEDCQQGWTYFVRFDLTNNPEIFTKPWIDFEHETKLAIA